MLFDEEWNAEQLKKLKAEYREDGLKEGIEQGIEKTKAEDVRALILEGFEDSLIQRCLKVTPEYVAALRDEIAQTRDR